MKIYNGKPLVTLIRSYLPTMTIGQLETNDNVFATIERPDLDNKPSDSCINEGLYWVERDVTGRHQFYRVTNVLDRTFIEIHAITSVNDLEGCIGISTRFTERYTFNYSESEQACHQLLNEFGDHGFYLQIRAYNPFVDNWIISRD